MIAIRTSLTSLITDQTKTEPVSNDTNSSYPSQQSILAQAAEGSSVTQAGLGSLTNLGPKQGFINHGGFRPHTVCSLSDQSVMEVQVSKDRKLEKLQVFGNLTINF